MAASSISHHGLGRPWTSWCLMCRDVLVPGALMLHADGFLDLSSSLIFSTHSMCVKFLLLFIFKIPWERFCLFVFNGSQVSICPSQPHFCVMLSTCSLLSSHQPPWQHCPYCGQTGGTPLPPGSVSPHLSTFQLPQKPKSLFSFSFFFFTLRNVLWWQILVLHPKGIRSHPSSYFIMNCADLDAKRFL